ncbi:MAG: 2-hydroxyacyl-CoA dehydratase, partial [Candidatus Dormibacteraeota bacterium]|nr:2-hydroxyacyl-CoA dehydratase [Candidatus Dormibacteraeota bacterium]
MVGPTVPVELVLAAGAYPVAVAPFPGGPTPEADRYLERHFDDGVRATLESLLRGDYDWLDLLVIPRTSDGYLELYYTLKEVVRLGGGEAVPPLHLYDLLHGRSEANRAYGLERVHELRSRLVAATGIDPSPERLRQAVGEVNAQRQAVRRLLEMRRDLRNGVSGVDAMVAIGAGRFLEPSAHRQLVERYLAEERPPLDGRPRLLVVAGVPLTDLRLHRLLEDAGGIVVAEDDAWGSRFAGVDVRGDATDILEAVFDKYFVDVPSPRVAPAAARDEWLCGQLSGDGLE